MAFDVGSESDASLSEPSQKFQPQEGDEEVLWEVEEITGEKGNKYKVRWKGVDPKTDKPWAQSWVLKSDCTDDLAQNWKLKRKKGRKSTDSKRTARTSVASTSKLPISKATNRSNSVQNTNSAKRGREKSSATASRSNRTATPKLAFKEEEEGESEVDDKPPPKPRTSTASSGRKATTLPKGTKRKLAETASVNLSANYGSGRAGTVDVEAEASNGSEPGKKKKNQQQVIFGRPKKKRKVLVDVDTPEPTPPSQPPVSKGHRKIKVITHEDEEAREERNRETEQEESTREEEEEERMVEDALSEAPASPGRGRDIDDDTGLNADFENGVDYPPEIMDEDAVIPTKTKGKEKSNGRAIDLPDDIEDEASVLSTSSKPKSPPRRQPSLPSSSPLPLSSTPPKFGPPRKKNISTGDRKSNAFISKSKATPASLESTTTGQPVTTAKKPKMPPALDQDRADSVLHRSASPLQQVHSPKRRLPTEEHSVFWDEDDSEQRKAILSPAAWKRLQKFELEVMNDTNKQEVAVADARSAAPKPSTSNNSKPSSSVPIVKDDAPPRRSANPTSHSYMTDVVPETETENSQSQELKLPSAATESNPNLLHPPATPQGRSTLKSRMRPRTPLSRAPSSLIFTADINKAGATPSKSLGPIPMISPSTFRPFLELDSSLPPSIIEPVNSDYEARKSGIDIDENDDEEDAPMSSIEQFDSPEIAERDRKKVGRKRVVILKGRVDGRKSKERNDITQGKAKENGSAEDIWDSEVVKRGRELAEAAKRRSNSETASSSPIQPATKKTVEDIMAASRSRSASNASLASDDNDDEEDKVQDEEMADASTAVVPPASGPPAVVHSQQEQATLRQMEEAYVDLDGGVDKDDNTGRDSSPTAAMDPYLLRQEEEESTQDLMMEIQQGQAQQRGMQDIDVEEGWVAGPSKQSDDAPISPQMGSLRGESVHRVSDAEDKDDSMSIPEIAVENPSRAASMRPYSSEEETRPMTRSRSRSKTPSVSGHQPKSKGKGKGKKALDVPSPVPSRSVSPVVEEPQVEPCNPSEQDFIDATTTIAAKLAEVSTLESDLSHERQKNESLQQQLHSLQEQLQQLTESSSRSASESAKRLESTQAQWMSEKSSWEAERSKLIANVDNLERSKASGEKDREFFREQYAKASGFVSSVRDENKDLEKRLQIAEDQTNAGVGLVKATFELRIKTLDDDVKAWRRMAEFLIEKDARSNSDDIRRRAAEEPELRARCLRQEENLEVMQERIEELEADVEQKDQFWSASKAELGQWKQETARLHADLNEALVKLDRIGRSGENSSQDNGHEYVYRCMWRKDSNGNEVCQETFLTMRELEQHLYSGGHIQ